MDDDLYERFGDILHELPEAEETLRQWDCDRLRIRHGQRKLRHGAPEHDQLSRIVTPESSPTA
ncbi:hypothetical protein [Mesorhizobium sp. A556]